jgi:phage tail-like protein
MPGPSYQTVNFHFSVKFNLPSDEEVKDADISFQSITGLDTSIETETVKEGGENRFEHTLPLRVKS